MSASSIVLLILILASFLVFARRVTQVARFVNLGDGTFGVDRPASRIRDLAVKGFAQRLVLRKPSGIGHALIFWGFFVLTYGTLEGLIRGLIPSFSFAWMGPIYPFMNTMQDIFGLLVLGALGVALFRRLVIRPTRLQGSFSHTVDAVIIIALIVILILAFYGMHIIRPKPGFMPVTDFLRGLVGGADPAAHSVAFEVFDWMHNLVVLGFLVYIPYSKHLHIVTALPNLFFRKLRVRGRIDKLDLENEEAERFGIVKITDFTKKELLDVVACTECGRCQEACPAYLTGKPLNPKQVILDLRTHLLAEGPSLLKNPAAEPARALYGDVIAEDVLWSCTTCMACEEACPVEIQPMSKLIGIRQSRVLMEGDFPEQAQTALRNIENQSNPWGLPQQERGAWARDLGVKTLAEDPGVEYLFFVGCAGSYDQRYVNVSRAFVKTLQHAGVSFGILGNEECCTGDSAKRIGNEYAAQMMAQQNVDILNGYGVKKIVTACPHCFNSIRNEFPQYGGNYEVIHHSRLISDLIREGKIKPVASGAGALGPVAYHDSCYLGRYNDVLDEPRNVLNAIPDLEMVEMPRNRKNSFCCGAGGGRMWMEETIGTGVNVARAREAIGAGACTVATACPFCMTMLGDGIGREEADGVKVKDIVEILAESLDAGDTGRGS